MTDAEYNRQWAYQQSISMPRCHVLMLVREAERWHLTRGQVEELMLLLTGEELVEVLRGQERRAEEVVSENHHRR